MTYDLMNRRDNVTKHHAGISASLAAIDAYIEQGVPVEKINMGSPFYIKWFATDPDANCNENPIGCRTLPMEDPLTGADLGRAGAFCWVDEVPKNLVISYTKAMQQGKYDFDQGGHCYIGTQKTISSGLGIPLKP